MDELSTLTLQKLRSITCFHFLIFCIVTISLKQLFQQNKNVGKFVDTAFCYITLYIISLMKVIIENFL